jgi:hypothetical protein
MLQFWLVDLEMSLIMRKLVNAFAAGGFDMRVENVPDLLCLRPGFWTAVLGRSRVKLGL